MVKYPEIEVELTGTDGNAFAILAKVKKATRTLPLEEREQFLSEAMSGDYDHLLQVVMEWVTVL